MTNARLVQVKYKGQVVDKAPMVCTPRDPNVDRYGGRIFDVCTSYGDTLFSAHIEEGVPALFCRTDHCAFAGSQGWLLIN